MNSDVKWMKWILEMFSLTMKLCLQIAIGHQNICEKNQIIYRHRWRCSCHIFPLGCSNTGNRSNPYCDGFCSLLVSTPELLNLNDSTTPLFRDTNMSNSLLCHFIPFDCATGQFAYTNHPRISLMQPPSCSWQCDSSKHRWKKWIHELVLSWTPFVSTPCCIPLVQDW